MKKIIVLFFACVFGFAQEMPKITKEGFTPIVVNVEGKTSAEIYTKAKEWVHTYYKNPSEVLKADISNDMIRIEGYAINGFQTKSLGMINSFDYTYTIEIEFKEGKYRYNYIVGQFWASGQKLTYNYKVFFKEDNSVRKIYQLAFDSINETANETSNSLFNYITGKTQSQKKDW